MKYFELNDNFKDSIFLSYFKSCAIVFSSYSNLNKIPSDHNRKLCLLSYYYLFSFMMHLMLYYLPSDFNSSFISKSINHLITKHIQGLKYAFYINAPMHFIIEIRNQYQAYASSFNSQLSQF